MEIELNEVVMILDDELVMNLYSDFNSERCINDLDHDSDIESDLEESEEEDEKEDEEEE